MRTSAFSLHAVVAALSLAALAGTATAAQVNLIQYDVIGGSFLGPYTSGSITGGTMSLTPVAGTITTPATGVPMHVHIVLTGPAGAFSAWLSNQPTFAVNITPNKVSFGAGIYHAAVFTSGGVSPLVLWIISSITYRRGATPLA